MEDSAISAFVPPPGAPWRARLACRMLRCAGWRVVFDGYLPGPRGVIIAYPHTSNWDFFVGILALWTLDLPIRWIGKETLFYGWFGALVGPLLRRWGGRPVVRHARSGAVDQMAHAMLGEPECWLALSPEGTRRRLDHWRSGFYHLARKLDVPLGLAYFDFPSRTVGIGGFMHLSGDVKADMDGIAGAYAGRRGCHPGRASVIALESSALQNAPVGQFGNAAFDTSLK